MGCHPQCSTIGYLQGIEAFGWNVEPVVHGDEFVGGFVVKHEPDVVRASPDTLLVVFHNAYRIVDPITGTVWRHIMTCAQRLGIVDVASQMNETCVACSEPDGTIAGQGDALHTGIVEAIDIC